jgi:hypothetical protein
MRRFTLLLAVTLMVFTVTSGYAQEPGGRCATGARDGEVASFSAPSPQRIGSYASSREAAVALPTLIEGNTLIGEHVRVIWGDDYDAANPLWQPGTDGNPIWVERLADAMELAWETLEGLGFAEPYGSPDYYLDVYVANTGVRVRESESDPWQLVTLSSMYYAYTDVHPSGACYFVFGEDYTPHTWQPLAVLDAVAAHELFHAVQRADYPWNDEILVPNWLWWQEGWFLEASATWMEEVVYPEVDDYAIFVERFLLNPQFPLNMKNGNHEYGAAGYVGYLWLEHGAEDFWIEVLANSYDPLTSEGDLEEAFEAALAGRGDPTFAEVTAAFWARAADPQPDLPWADAALYKSDESPAYTVADAKVPFRCFDPESDHPYIRGYDNALPPHRQGANLYEVMVTEPFTLSVRTVEPTEGLRIALVRPGQPPELHPAGNSAPGLEIDPADFEGVERIYFAVVNVSELTGTVRYDLHAATKGDSGGSGGCFIQVLPR